jgi:uncharacterized protein YjbI with pentapeptide repeats
MTIDTYTNTYRRRNLQGKSFKNQDLTSCDFSGADIRGADFTGANLTNASFYQAIAGLTNQGRFRLFIAAVILCIIAGIASFVSAYVITRYISYDVTNPFPLSTGIPIFFVLLALGSGLLVMTYYQGLTKSLQNIGLLATLLFTIIIVLAGLSNDNGNYFQDFSRIFRLSNFANTISGEVRLTEPTFVILMIAIIIGSVLILITVHSVVLVLASNLGDTFFVNIANAGIETTALLITGIVTANSARNFAHDERLLRLECLYNNPFKLEKCEEPKFTIFLNSLNDTVTSVLPAMIAVTFIAVTIALIFCILSSKIAKQVVLEDDKFLFFRQLGIIIGTMGGTSFQEANLTETNFSHALLKNTDFRQSQIERTLWRQAEHLDLARLENTILSIIPIRQLLITGYTENLSLVGANLRGANLICANLGKVDLENADLTNATFAGANLNNANLTQVQAINTDFTNAEMTGTCLEAWNIDHTTKLEDVEARYIYLLKQPKPGTDDRERRPSSGEFAPGDFTRLFKEVTDTIDLIFRNGIDWRAFMSSLKKVQVENNDTELVIQSIENKGDGVVVVKVSVPPETNKAKIHAQFIEVYEESIKSLEEKYQAELKGKEGEIAAYRQQNQAMMSFLNNIVQFRNIHTSQKLGEKLIIIRFTQGDLSAGFALVEAEIREVDHPLPISLHGSLPVNNIWSIYQVWQEKYQELIKVLQPIPRIKMKPTFNQLSQKEINSLQSDVKQITQTLTQEINTWFNSPEFSTINNQLRSLIQPDERLRIVFQSADPNIAYIPWHLWEFVTTYRYAEIGISGMTSQRLDKSKSRRSQVRILAILGNDQGINVKADQEFLEKLQSAETVFLITPTRAELDRYLWDELGWDILSFSGHSYQQDKQGKMIINEQEHLTIEELKFALREAISKGLHLAIFNSCDGLGLAKELIDLHIPAIIVMKESVPDLVAQSFLKNLLSSLVQGKPLYFAIRQAREKLQGLENQFPAASWLPILYQNLAEVPLTWQQLQGNKQTNLSDIIFQLNLDIQQEICLNEEDKKEALQQIELLAEASQDLNLLENQRLVKSTLRMLKGIIQDYPEALMIIESLQNLSLGLQLLLRGHNE